MEVFTPGGWWAGVQASPPITASSMKGAPVRRHSLRQSSAMPSSPRRSSSTMRIFSSAEKCRLVACRMSLTVSSALSAACLSRCLIVFPVGLFADVDRETQNLSAATIAPCYASDKGDHSRPSWLPCDMDPIMELARAHGVFVIEDRVQAHGACYKKRPSPASKDAGMERRANARSHYPQDPGR